MSKRLVTMRGGPLVYAGLFPEHTISPTRSAKASDTSYWQEKLNIKRSSDKFALILGANFGFRDWMVTLTYDNEHLPPNKREAAKVLKKFIRQLRESRNGFKRETKYAYVHEGQHGDKRLHHHMVVNRYDGDMQLLNQLWPYGNVDVKPIGKYGYAGLARYLTKEPRELGRAHVGDRMWTPSRGLEKPVVAVTEVPDDYKLDAPDDAFAVERSSTANGFGSYDYLNYSLPYCKCRRPL